MEAAGESTGCEVQIEWQGDHEIFDHDEYQSASRTCKHHDLHNKAQLRPLKGWCV